MVSCAEASEQASNVRAANPNYSNFRQVADYVVTVASWQNNLVCAGHYNGPADGIWGPNSRKGVQLQMRAYEYGGPIDGDWGTNTWKAIQRFAAADGNYDGPIDGAPGGFTWEGIFYAVVPLTKAAPDEPGTDAPAEA